MTGRIGDDYSSLRSPRSAFRAFHPSRDMHYLLMYDVVDDYLTRRAEYRGEHLALARAAHGRGELILAGALADPADGVVMLFKGDTPDAAERFAESDPYVRHGLVTRWRVRPWTTVVGDDPAVVVP